MIDPETRDVLRAVLEELKTQMIYVRNLHEALATLYDALKETLKKTAPQFEEIHRAETAKIRVNAPQNELIARIDELLQRLEIQ